MNARLEKLEKLLTKEPNDAFLNFGVAMELAKEQRFQESLERFEKVVTLDPNYVAAYFHKAKTLLAKGDTNSAKAELQRGISQAATAGEMHAKGEMQELLDSLG